MDHIHDGVNKPFGPDDCLGSEPSGTHQHFSKCTRRKKDLAAARPGQT